MICSFSFLSLFFSRRRSAVYTGRHTLFRKKGLERVTEDLALPLPPPLDFVYMGRWGSGEVIIRGDIQVDVYQIEGMHLGDHPGEA
jgi:hypothetical protein